MPYFSESKKIMEEIKDPGKKKQKSTKKLILANPKKFKQQKKIVPPPLGQPVFWGGEMCIFCAGFYGFTKATSAEQEEKVLGSRGG